MPEPVSVRTEFKEAFTKVLAEAKAEAATVAAANEGASDAADINETVAGVDENVGTDDPAAAGGEVEESPTVNENVATDEPTKSATEPVTNTADAKKKGRPVGSTTANLISNMQSIHQKAVNKLEAELAKTQGMLSQLLQERIEAKAPPAQAQPEAMTEEQLADIYSDPMKYDKYIREQIDKGVERKLGKPFIQKSQAGEEIESFYSTHPDSGPYVPLMKEILSELPPGSTFDRNTLAWAYRRALGIVSYAQNMQKQAGSGQPTGGNAGNVTQAGNGGNGKTLTPAQRAELAKQTRSMQTDAGEAGSETVRRQPKNGKEAARMALEELRAGR